METLHRETLLRPLKAVADASRLRIVGILSRGTFSVAELTEILGIGQSTVSKHLRILVEAGLVAVRRAGTWTLCSLPGATAESFDGRLLALVREAAERASEGDAAAIERVLIRRRTTTSEFFRKTAGRWDLVRDEMLGAPTHLERLVDLAGTRGTVVDLGTGTGVLLPRLARASERVIGVDASPEMLEEARRRVDESGLHNADLRLGALEHLPLSDGEADTMVANLVLHHVADPPAVLREIRRGLAPDGRLVIAELGEHADGAFWRNLGARWPGFRPAELGEWLEAAGFAAVRTEKHGANGGRPRVFLMEARRDASRSSLSRNRRKHG
jgi:ArsR family transcriptional regulator